MSFLSSLFLLALPLAAAPIVLHLYHRRQRVSIPWAAMQFLEDAEATGRSSRRLEELLLLFLRTATVALLVLACARPALYWFRSGHAPQETILVLDDSMSMSRVFDASTSFDRMRQHALDTLDELHDGDYVQVLLAAQQRWLTPEALRLDRQSRNRLRQKLDDLAPCGASAEFVDVLTAVAVTQPHDNVFRRQTIVFTDGQANNWNVADEEPWDRFKSQWVKSMGPATLQIIDCALQADAIDNLAVVELSAARPVITDQQSTMCMVTVKNFGTKSSPSTTLTWQVDDRVSSEDRVPPLEPGESVSLEQLPTFSGIGPHRVSAQLAASDQLVQDNTNATVVEVIDQIPILIIARGPDYDPIRSDAHFVLAALGYESVSADEGDVIETIETRGWRSVFRPEVVDPVELESIDLSLYRCVVVPNLSPLSEPAIARLGEYTRAGGGLWLALGARIDTRMFNRLWYAEGEGLSPVSLLPRDLVKPNDDRSVHIHPPDGDHPATAFLGDTQRLDLDRVLVTDRHELVIRAPWQTSSASGYVGQPVASVLLETQQGQPFAVESHIGRGRVMVLAVPACREWSNLVLTRAFVVMVHDWLDLLTNARESRFNFALRQSLQFAPPSPSFVGRAIVELPGNRQTQLVDVTRDGRHLYRCEEYVPPGSGQVTFVADHDDDVDGVKETSYAFEVERPSQESDLRGCDEAGWQWLHQLAAMDGVEIPADLPNQRREPPTPIGLSLLTGALLMFCAEFWLASEMSRRRQPSSGAHATSRRRRSKRHPSSVAV